MRLSSPFCWWHLLVPPARAHDTPTLPQTPDCLEVFLQTRPQHTLYAQVIKDGVLEYILQGQALRADSLRRQRKGLNQSCTASTFPTSCPYARPRLPTTGAKSGPGFYIARLTTATQACQGKLVLVRQLVEKLFLWKGSHPDGGASLLDLTTTWLVVITTETLPVKDKKVGQTICQLRRGMSTQ